MRNAFAAAITEFADQFPQMVLLSGDIGNRLFDLFKETNANRFFNCGVAEANMTGVAAGLASCGLQPITYSIAPFNVLRCLEQIRNDICYPQLPVIIVGAGAGLSYAQLGPTHHTMEDIGVLRTLPNMQLLCPADSVETKAALFEALHSKRPTYIRLGKKGEPLIHQKPISFSIGEWITVQTGSQIALLGVGTMLPTAIACADILKQNGISCKVVSMHTIKPLDSKNLFELFKNYETIAIIEEHAVACGAGSAVLEFASSQRLDPRKIFRFGGPDQFYVSCDNQAKARGSYGLDPKTIAQKLVAHVKG